MLFVIDIRHTDRLFDLVGVLLLYKQKTAYEMRISDWSSDVCSSDLEEMQLIKNRLPDAERALALQLLPRDAADARPAMLEIRAGTGGDEAALFAGDLFRMYQR